MKGNYPGHENLNLMTLKWNEQSSVIVTITQNREVHLSQLSHLSKWICVFVRYTYIWCAYIWSVFNQTKEIQKNLFSVQIVHSAVHLFGFQASTVHQLQASLGASEQLWKPHAGDLKLHTSSLPPCLHSGWCYLPLTQSGSPPYRCLWRTGQENKKAKPMNNCVVTNT